MPPRPTRARQHQHPAPEASPGGVLRHQRGYLRQREYEDEVEEQLERRNPLLLCNRHHADERCIKSRTVRPKTRCVRGRITIALAIFAAVAFPGAAFATTGGPVISEFETGLTSGVGLWGITAGPDGNLWFTEETHNAVGRDHSRRRDHRVRLRASRRVARRGSSPAPTATSGSRWPEETARSPSVTKAGEVTEFETLTAGDPDGHRGRPGQQPLVRRQRGQPDRPDHAGRQHHGVHGRPL